MSIAQKGWVLVAIPLAAQVLFLIILGATRRHQEDAQKWAIHTHEVIAQAETYHRLVLEAQSHMRGYVLTGDDKLILPYERARRDIDPAYEELRGMVNGRSSQQAKVIRMQADVASFLVWMDENMRLMKQKQREAAVERIRARTGVNFLEDLRKQVTAFLKTEEELDEERRLDLVNTGRIQNLVLAGGGVLALGSSLTLLVAFSRSVSRRVAVLIDNTRRLAEGKQLAPPLQGSDELRRIDAVFHEMAETIRLKEQENELFVYSVSHDLRSPLVNLQGFSQELAMVINDLGALVEGSDLPPKTKACASKLIDRDADEAIRFIQSAVTRLAGIIDALLRLSRVGRVEFRWLEVDVQTVVRRIVAALHGSLSQQQATVEVTKLPPCWGDLRAVDQVFANLIGNAVNYLDANRPGRIEVGCLADDPANPGFHTYFVKDNGLGIPEAFQAKVFVAFQRLYPDLAPGEGIGLALVRRVLDRLGGKVWLESKESQGSTFFVSLPASIDVRASGVITRAGPDLSAPAPSGTPKEGSAEWQAITPSASPTPKRVK